ncbi:hypothetical protein BARBAKC583_1329 [Bartonella bacilliformis KC583]|uniref:Uncharacterized protein n=1 Tax=Bartonella bacilliformis (strain ATCC 35685 / KC583 / Herrer 020/F12,63) TaxID=360095 RepID=A1UUC4_BARBK|nr:hypothetical protein BARBAKC583_1329 [Bartonella bacilliformis KC583]
MFFCYSLVGMKGCSYIPKKTRCDSQIIVCDLELNMGVE